MRLLDNYGKCSTKPVSIGHISPEQILYMSFSAQDTCSWEDIIETVHKAYSLGVNKLDKHKFLPFSTIAGPLTATYRKLEMSIQTPNGKNSFYIDLSHQGTVRLKQVQEVLRSLIVCNRVVT